MFFAAYYSVVSSLARIRIVCYSIEKTCGDFPTGKIFPYAWIATIIVIGRMLRTFPVGARTKAFCGLAHCFLSALRHFDHEQSKRQSSGICQCLAIR